MEVPTVIKTPSVVIRRHGVLVVPKAPSARQVLVQTAASTAWLQPEFLSDEEARALETHCLSLPLLHHPTLKVFGKLGTMHRSVGFFSDVSKGYRYSGQIALSAPLTPELAAIMARVNAVLGTDFNGVLVNHYANGRETIGAHSDDEKGLARRQGERGGVVAGISLGAVRTMRFRPKRQTVPAVAGRIDCELPHGSLMVMEGAFQSEFTHEVPSQAHVEGARISLTFRAHIN